jgi:hypothetical protein
MVDEAHLLTNKRFGSYGFESSKWSFLHVFTYHVMALPVMCVFSGIFFRLREFNSGTSAVTKASSERNVDVVTLFHF